MPQVVQIKRRVTGAGVPTTLEPGELAYNDTGQLLYVGDRTRTAQMLVSPARQVELTGAQTIAGNKTIPVANLKVTGGTALDVLQTDGAGNLSFVAAPPPTPATGPEMVAGTANNIFGTPLNTMALTGSAVTALTTTAKTLVPAINEIKAAVDLLALGGLFVGSFQATAGTIVWTTASGQIGNTLPAAAAANRGWYLISDEAGNAPPVGAPPATYDIGDWVVSNGAAWTRLAFGGGMAAVLASAVTVNPAVNGAIDVQAALESLDADKVDGPAIAVLNNIATYNGTTGKLIKDGGTTIAALQALIAAAGDVVGPAAAVADNLAAFDTATGKLIKDGGTSVAALNAAIGAKVDGVAQDAVDAAQDAAIATKGDVFGPLASIADNLAVYSNVTGKLIKDGGTSIAAMTVAVNSALALKLSLTGGTMTGAILLPAVPPVLPEEASNKKYVDDAVASATGGLAVVSDGISIVGDGLPATPLMVALVDGGVY